MDLDIQIKLIQELRDGSNDAFSKLYLVYADQVYAFALKITKSPAKSQDILQETFLRIWNKRETVKTGTSFKSFLFQIAYHIIIDQFRKQINTVDFENYISSEHYQEYAENDAEQLLNYDDYQRRVGEILSAFTDRQQQIFKLSRIEGLSAKEIALKLAISEKTVNNQITLVMSAFKSDLMLYIVFLSSCF